VLVKVDAFGTARLNANADTRSAEKTRPGDTRLLALLTVSALVALTDASELRATLALGCCHAVLLAVVLSLLQTSHRDTVLPGDSNDGLISSSRLLSQPALNHNTQQVLVDVSFAAMVAHWLPALLLESFSTRSSLFATTQQQILIVGLGISMVIIHVFLNRAIILAVSRILM
jgi:hypothetical protein